MVFKAVPIVLRNFVLAIRKSRVATNLFPVPRTPKAPVAPIAAKILQGELEIPVKPVPTPEGFRGKISYDRDKCTGCKSCIKVCSPKAIRYVPFTEEEAKEAKEKGLKGKGRVRFYLARCITCGECADICPTKCITMTDEFLLADVDKFSDNLVVGREKKA